MRSMFRGITRRWLTNGFAIIAAFLAILGAAALLIVRAYYYQLVETALHDRADAFRRSVTATVLPDTNFETVGLDLIAQFNDNAKMELQVLGDTGYVMLSSTGFLPVQNDRANDFSQAVKSDEGFGFWTGETPDTGERVMALTVLERDNSGRTVGALRYVVSLRMVDYQITLIALGVLLLIVVILFLVGISNYVFLSSIVVPVTEVGKGARRIASGDYDYRIPKQYNDEIGDLSDTLNFMAGELAEGERLKNEFISSMSHELRTPLTAIAGWSETLAALGENDPEMLQRGLKVITDETARLTGIVEGLLDFSRIQNGTIRLECAPLDIAAELEETVFLFRERAAQAGLRLEFSENGEPLFLQGDRDKLRQVFVNLLDNAVKYSGRGGCVTVSVTYEQEWVCITVRDTGVGIAPEILPRVTEKFFRGSKSHPGSGIGLALSDEIVRMHGGSLRVESTLGEGTVVTVTLPAGKFAE